MLIPFKHLWSLTLGPLVALRVHITDRELKPDKS